jgi:ferrous iron transport protein A
MDDEHNNQKKRHRRHQGWKFTFLGERETSTKQEEEKNRTQFLPELVNDQLKMKQVFPLSSTQVGDRVVISQILSGKNMLNRLNDMGLALGSEVAVISKMTSGSIIICIQDRQIGLGAGMANQVMVKAIEKYF